MMMKVVEVTINFRHLQLQTEFLNRQVDYDTFARQVRGIVERFYDTGTVCKDKSLRRRSVLIEVALEDQENRLQISPTKSLKQVRMIL